MRPKNRKAPSIDVKNTKPLILRLGTQNKFKFHWQTITSVHPKSSTVEPKNEIVRPTSTETRKTSDFMTADVVTPVKSTVI